MPNFRTRSPFAIAVKSKTGLQMPIRKDAHSCPGASVALACLTLLFCPASQASEYGCKVLLCLANPNGPMAVQECVPPIRQLYRDLSRGRPFPSCEMAEGPGGKSYARQTASYYDTCPEGTAELGQGAFALQHSRTRSGSGTSTPTYTGVIYSGIGSGEGITPSSTESGSALPAKICVGKKLGSTPTTIGNDDGQITVEAGVYDSVVTLDAHSSPRAIDVFVDDRLYRRVRW